MTKCILNFLKISKSNRGKTHWTIKSFILQSSHIMILNSTKLGGNRTKDVEVGPDRRTRDRQTDSYVASQTMLAGGTIIQKKNKNTFRVMVTGSSALPLESPSISRSGRQVIPSGWGAIRS